MQRETLKETRSTIMAAKLSLLTILAIKRKPSLLSSSFLSHRIGKLPSLFSLSPRSLFGQIVIPPPCTPQWLPLHPPFRVLRNRKATHHKQPLPVFSLPLFLSRTQPSKSQWSITSVPRDNLWGPWRKDARLPKQR